jgi:hypothetical protein
MSSAHEKLMRSVAQLEQLNARLVPLEAAEAERLERQRVAQIRSDAIIQAEASAAARKEIAEREAAEQRENDRRQRRAEDVESGRFARTHDVFAKVLEPFGRTAPVARADESYYPYVRRMTDIAQRFLPGNHPLAHAEFVTGDTRVPTDSLLVLSDQVIAGVKKALRDPSTCAKGTMREVRVVDSETGRVMKEYVGQDCFVSQFSRPARRVKWFATHHDSNYPGA